MAEVKRYDLDDYSPVLHESSTGAVIYSCDHVREVTRLQRARARNLVRRLLLQAERSQEHWGHDLTDRAFRRWADLISAKYLGSES